MSAKQLMLPANRAFDSDGAPAIGARAFLYQSGTSTPAVFYDDVGLTVSLGSHITANSAGRFTPMPYQESTTPFRIVIEDAEGAVLDDIDPFYFGQNVYNVSGSISVATRTALAGLTGAAGSAAILTEAGRAGTFIWSSANNSAYVTADTQQGLYVAPATDTTGASGAWIRSYNGQANALWFGFVADMTANGVGTNNTPMFDAARATLIAAKKSWLHIPQQAAAYRFSTAPAAIHDGLLLTGERVYSNPGQVGATTYVGIQIYNGTVLGFAADVPGFKLVAYTDNASNALAFEYQSSTGSGIKDLIMYSEGGVGTAGHGIETFVKTELENLRITGFAGNGVKLSGDDSGTANQYGNTVNSHLQNVYCTSNKLHGFRVTGNNGSAIQFTDCAAQSNGGAGFLDQGPFGNSYTGCLAASNNASFGTPAGYSAAQRTQVTTDYAQLATQLNGSFVCTGSVAASTYTGCYVEVGNGSYPDLSYACSIHGGQLASYVWQFNVNSNGYTTPTSSSSRGIDTNTINLSGGPASGQSAVALGNGRVYWGADRGLTIQGAPNNVGNYDVSIVNKNDAAVMQVNTGTTTTRFLGNVQIDFKYLLLNGTTTFPTLVSTQAVAFSHATNGLNLAGWGSSYDVVLGNKTNQIALRVPTGTQNVEMPGNLTITGTVGASNFSGTHSGTSSGTNTGDQTITLTGGVTGSGTGSFATTVASVPAAAMPALTGDVTTSAGAVATTIAAGAVSLAKMANMATSSLIYRKTAGSGAPEVNTLATLKTDLALATVATSGLASDLTGTLAAAQLPALTGDITTSAGSAATTLATNIVTYAKFQQVAASSLVGNATGSLANATAITLAGGLAFSGSTLTAAGALTPTSVASTGAVTSSGGGVGYATGAGGTVTQATSKATGVTLDKLSGDITLNAAALAASTTVSFVFTSNKIAAGDILILTHSATGTFGSYVLNAHGFASGSCTIDVRNVSLGSLAEAIVIRYAIIKAVQA